VKRPEALPRSCGASASAQKKEIAQLAKTPERQRQARRLGMTSFGFDFREREVPRRPAYS